MRIRDWRDLLEDVVDGPSEPAEWRAVAGDRDGGLGESLYLAHPDAGVYHLRTYAKNPFEVKGYGGEVAGSFDDELAALFPDRAASGRFAVQQPPTDEDHAESIASEVESVVQTHADAPTEPQDLFEDVMDALESPAFGPMEHDLRDRPASLEQLDDRFDEARRLLDAELEELIDADGVGRGFE